MMNPMPSIYWLCGYPNIALQIEVVAACTGSVQGVEAIKTHRPEILFLDIEMPQMNGFQVLEAVGDLAFSLVFVTAYDRFALKAFKYSALDYLLKPIDTQELVTTVQELKSNTKPVRNRCSICNSS